MVNPQINPRLTTSRCLPRRAQARSTSLVRWGFFGVSETERAWNQEAIDPTKCRQSTPNQPTTTHKETIRFVSFFRPPPSFQQHQHTERKKEEANNINSQTRIIFNVTVSMVGPYSMWVFWSPLCVVFLYHHHQCPLSKLNNNNKTKECLTCN